MERWIVTWSNRYEHLGMVSWWQHLFCHLPRPNSWLSYENYALDGLSAESGPFCSQHDVSSALSTGIWRSNVPVMQIWRMRAISVVFMDIWQKPAPSRQRAYFVYAMGKNAQITLRAALNVLRSEWLCLKWNAKTTSSKLESLHSCSSPAGTHHKGDAYKYRHHQWTSSSRVILPEDMDVGHDWKGSYLVKW